MKDVLKKTYRLEGDNHRIYNYDIKFNKQIDLLNKEIWPTMYIQSMTEGNSWVSKFIESNRPKPLTSFIE